MTIVSFLVSGHEVGHECKNFVTGCIFKTNMKGIEHLNPLYQSILNNQTIDIHYQSFT